MIKLVHSLCKTKSSDITSRSYIITQAYADYSALKSCARKNKFCGFHFCVLKQNYCTPVQDSRLLDKQLSYFRTHPKYRNGVFHLEDKCTKCLPLENLTWKLCYDDIAETGDLTELRIVSLVTKASCESVNISGDERRLMECCIQNCVKSVGTMSVNSLVVCIYHLKHIRGIVNSDILNNLVISLDQRCCELAKGMKIEEILKMFDVWEMSHNITSLQFYTTIVKTINSTLINTDMKTHKLENIIQLMFYVGLTKKNSITKKQMPVILNVLECLHTDAERMSIDDVCVVCSAAFKTSTKVTSPNLLKIIISKIENNIVHVVQDTQVLVTMVKVLRHTNYYDEKLLQKLVQGFEKKINNASHTSPEVNFTELAHVLAFFANAKFDHEHHINSVISKGLAFVQGKELYRTHPIFRVRLKDIDRFLWSVAVLRTGETDISLLKTSVLPHLNNPDVLFGSPELIVGCLLSFATLGYYPEEILLQLPIHHIASKLSGPHTVRNRSRLVLLLACLDIEGPSSLKGKFTVLRDKLEASIPAHNVRAEVKQRKSLEQIFSTMKLVATAHDIHNLQMKSIIPGLNMSGIIFEVPRQKYLVNIEVLDPSLCLNSSTPTGLIKLKMRLMKSMGYTVVEVTHRDIEQLESLSEDQRFIYVEDNILKPSMQT